MPHLRFESKLLSDQDAHFVPVPAEVVRVIGSAKRGPVTVTINGYAFQAAVAVHRGRYFIAVRDAVREAAGVVAGDAVAIGVEVDPEVRTADLPADLEAVLQQDPQLLAAFEALSQTHKREVVGWVSEAKRPQTRQRRLAQALRFVQGRRSRRSS
jgi:Bacteriocin-protection, YdeI or OmpD-Associated/Domain of unknown function (DUF1905)